MSKKKPNSFVTIEVCAEKHDRLVKEIGSLQSEVKVIKVALIGEDFRGGIVKELQDLRSMVKGSLSGKDKAAIIVTAITAIVALIKSFLG